MSFAREHRGDPLIDGALSAAEAALHELPEALVFVFDEELRIEQIAGHALERISGPGGYREGRLLADAVPGELWRRIEPLLRSALRGETRSREIWTTGQRHCLSLDAGPLDQDRRCGDGATARAGGVAVMLDVTARRRAELMAPRSFSELRPALSGAQAVPVGTGLLDLDGRWLLADRALCDITGYTSDELLGTRFDGIVHPDDLAGDREQHQRLLAGEIPAYQVAKRYFDAAGETVSAIVSYALVRGRDGQPLYRIAQLRDISERRRLEQDTRALADHDPLTGLRNSRLFAHDLKLQVARSTRYGEVAGLMIIDLDAFPLDGTGEPGDGERVGEQALAAVGRALTRRLRETDLVARLGADQFAVLLPHIDEEGLSVVAEGLSRVISACGVEIADELVHPSASIGYAIVDSSVDSAEQALSQADLHMRTVGRAAAGAGS